MGVWSERPEVGAFEVDELDAGRRLDRVLARRLGIPVSVVQRWTRKGSLRVDGVRVKIHHRLRLGERVEWHARERLPKGALRRPRGTCASPQLDVASKREIVGRVVYRDDALLVYDKPAGLVVHAGSGHRFGLVDQLAETLGRTARRNRPVPVHRLDRATSGLVLFALDPRALRALHEAFRAGEVRKRYVAWCSGRLEPPEGVIDLPLLRGTGKDGRSVVVAQPRGGAKRAVTGYRVEEVGRVAGLAIVRVRLEPQTGRRHQLRVHLAHRGAPIVGDARYGDRRVNRRIASACGIERLALHAAGLELSHPMTGKRLRFEAPIAPELEGLLSTPPAP